jgi:hypothetical protein
MAYRPTTGSTGSSGTPPSSSTGTSTPRVTRPPSAPEPAEERWADEEQRVAITLTVGDGFKFGCGLILAGVAFYFALIMVVAAAFLVATILNLPLPFAPTR